MVISDAARCSGPLRIDDLHDVTGHHRYYGSSACMRPPQLSRVSDAPWTDSPKHCIWRMSP